MWLSLCTLNLYIYRSNKLLTELGSQHWCLYQNDHRAGRCLTFVFLLNCPFSVLGCYSLHDALSAMFITLVHSPFPLHLLTHNLSVSWLIFALCARFHHLQGEPWSQAQICAHCGACAVSCSLNCTLVSLNALDVSGTSRLKQWFTLQTEALPANSRPCREWIVMDWCKAVLQLDHFF